MDLEAPNSYEVYLSATHFTSSKSGDFYGEIESKKPVFKIMNLLKPEDVVFSGAKLLGLSISALAIFSAYF